MNINNQPPFCRLPQPQQPDRWPTGTKKLPTLPDPFPRKMDPDRWPTGTRKLPTLPDPFPRPASPDRWPTGTKKLPKLGEPCPGLKGFPKTSEPPALPARLKGLLDGAQQAFSHFLLNR